MLVEELAQLGLLGFQFAALLERRRRIGKQVVEFFALARSVRDAARTGIVAGQNDFEQLVDTATGVPILALFYSALTGRSAQVAGAITPVPGGVGPMTIACLLRNTLVSACRREGVALDERL